MKSSEKPLPNYPRILHRVYKIASKEVKSPIPQIEELEKELYSKESISEKLDHWANSIATILAAHGLQDFNSLNPEEYDVLISSIFGEPHRLVSPILIPENTYFSHFVRDPSNIESLDDLNNPEFTFWFLKFHAKNVFETIIDSKEVLKAINSPYALEFCNIELHKLQRKEEQAKALMEEKNINYLSNLPYDSNPNEYGRWDKEIKLLRVVEGYYTTNALLEVHSPGNRVVRYYAEYVLLKGLLEEKSRNLFSGGRGNKEKDILKVKLNQMFDRISEFKKVMEILVEKGYVAPITYIWKDEGKGNKSILAALIKDLHQKGYYKDNRKLSIDEIQAICKNTFGWKVSIDTIKKANPIEHDFSFIPTSIN